jgi:hypothetical protein
MSGARGTIRDGLVVGFVASVAVAVFYAVFDLLAARGALHTPTVLGSAVFRGLRDPTVLQLPLAPDTAAVVWYSLLHLALSLVIGLMVMTLVADAERTPSHAPMVLSIIVAGFFVTVLAVGYLTRDMRPVLPWWSIVAANLLAVVVASEYVVRRHPGIFTRLVPVARRTVTRS